MLPVLRKILLVVVVFSFFNCTLVGCSKKVSQPVTKRKQERVGVVFQKQIDIVQKAAIDAFMGMEFKAEKLTYTEWDVSKKSKTSGPQIITDASGVRGKRPKMMGDRMCTEETKIDLKSLQPSMTRIFFSGLLDCSPTSQKEAEEFLRTYRDQKKLTAEVEKMWGSMEKQENIAEKILVEIENILGEKGERVTF